MIRLAARALLRFGLWLIGVRIRRNQAVRPAQPLPPIAPPHRFDAPTTAWRCRWTCQHCGRSWLSAGRKPGVACQHCGRLSEDCIVNAVFLAPPENH